MYKPRPDDALLLLLDLAAENPVDAAGILSQLAMEPPPRVLRATDFGATAAGRGWDPAQLPAWSEAIERMLQRAHDHSGPSTELFVAGRAGLGSFAELGLRVSSWRDHVTLLNQRKGQRTWDVCRLEGEPTAAPFFDEVVIAHNEHLPSSARGRVAVVVSTGDAVPRHTLAAFFADHREPWLGTVTLRACPPPDGAAKFVTPESTPTLARELCLHFDRIRHAFPEQRGLAVFVAGPAQLAFLAGRAVNPSVYRSTWFPHWCGDRYAMGAKVPWLDTIRVRMLLASPSDLSPLHLDEEELVTLTALDGPLARDRVDIVVDQRATYHDLFDVLASDRPHIVHFGGHGNTDAIAFVKEGMGTRDAVPVSVVAEALRATTDPHDRPRLVILNACKTASIAKALTEVVDFAIGMTHVIKNDRAIAFTRRFYDALARGRTVRGAFDEARAYFAQAGDHAAGLIELCCREGCDPDGLRFFAP